MRGRRGSRGLGTWGLSAAGAGAGVLVLLRVDAARIVVAEFGFVAVDVGGGVVGFVGAAAAPAGAAAAT